MRGLGKLTAAPCRCTAAAASASQIIFSSPAYSTFSAGGDGGGGGSGRGRGRGLGPPPPPPSRVPGQTQPNPEDDPILRSFPSWNTAPPPSASGRGRALSPPPVAVGLGRGHPLPPPSPTESPDPNSKKPIFFRREEPSLTPSSDPDSSSPRPPRFASILRGSGRGQPARPADPAPEPIQENRHLRRRPAVVPVTRGDGPEQRSSQPGGPGRGGRGRGGRGMVRGRGRGRGRGQRDTGDDSAGLFLGDNADGERLEKMLGEENMKTLTEEFDKMSYRALPSLLDDAYLDALHTNNMIEYEPEYLVDFDNPDIDEKPPMPLEEVLQKIKPFVIAYEGMQSQEEWEEAIKDLMERLPHMKELIDMYCGPDRVTAKQQQQEMERMAKTLPENVPSSVKRFTDRAVLSLQSNPGWGWDKKYQFMDKLVRGVSKHYSH